MITGGTGNLSQAIGHVRLGAEVEFHIGVDREAVETFLADAPPFAVFLHKPLIDPETGSFAHGALDCGKPGFDGFDGRVRHNVRVSIASPEKGLQPS